jgi:hypothetical protein
MDFKKRDLAIPLPSAAHVSRLTHALRERPSYEYNVKNKDEDLIKKMACAQKNSNLFPESPRDYIKTTFPDSVE